MSNDWIDILDALPRETRARLRERDLPRSVEPMLATLTDRRFSDPSWIFERKLDGVRCVAVVGDDGVRLLSRTGKPMQGTYPEIAEALAAAEPMVVDGEVVAFEGKRTSFSRLQGRLGLTDPDRARATGIPVFYYVFDLLQLGRVDVRALPLTVRKQLLKSALEFGGPLRFTPHRVGDGERAYERACKRGDEGVIAKRAGSRYVSGRSSDWLKLKCVRDQEFVVGGWTDPDGARVGLGALLVGYYDADRLVYAGKVGTGFDQRTLTSLRASLDSLAATEMPFDEVPPAQRGSHWVRPEVVAQIGFAEWTNDGRLRHPRFLGLRDDKPASEVRRETR